MATETPAAKEKRLAAELPIKQWVKDNHGIISRISRKVVPAVSVSYAYQIAYNRAGPSKDLRVERALKAAGCPLIQKVSG